MYYQLLAILVAAGICVLGLALWMRRQSQNDQVQEDVEAMAVQHALREGVRTGTLTPEGVPACQVCSAPAVAAFPMSAASWMDRLPLLNRLFSLPPRYVIVDDEDRGVCLCRSHKQVAVKKLETFHAMLRAERAQFNSEQADKVSQMDTGGLLQCVRDQYQFASQALNTMIAATTPPRLPAAQIQVLDPKPVAPSVTIVMAPSEGNGDGQ